MRPHGMPQRRSRFEVHAVALRENVWHGHVMTVRMSDEDAVPAA